MATITLTTEEYAALVADRDALRGECDGLRGEVRTLKVEVSLLEERLKAHLRKLFDAKSEARGSEQKDMFFVSVKPPAFFNRSRNSRTMPPFSTARRIGHGRNKGLGR